MAEESNLLLFTDLTDYCGKYRINIAKN